MEDTEDPSYESQDGALHSFITPGRPILAVIDLHREFFASTRGRMKPSAVDRGVFSDCLLGYNACPKEQISTCLIKKTGAD